MKDSPEKDPFLAQQILQYIAQCLAHSDFPNSASLVAAQDDYTIVQRDLEQIGEAVKIYPQKERTFCWLGKFPSEASAVFAII
jgi:hypothetical protein